MDILYTVDEKYLQAIEELRYGELPKALRLFNEIIIADPNYARAHYQLGCIHQYELKDFQTAGYYYKKCMDLESAFPDVYEHYLKLIITLAMHKTIQQVAEKALTVPGVRKANIYESLGLYAEEQQDLPTAAGYYKKAADIAANEDDHNLYHGHLKRINVKKQAKQNMIYAYQG